MKTPVLLLALLSLAAAARAEVKTREIDYKDGETALRGYLAWDDAAKEKRPGVIVVHEWWGHNAYARSRAEMLARLGYVAFALDMYGAGVSTKSPEEAGRLAAPFRKDADFARRRARAGLDVLLAQPQVDASRVAAIGYCFGGAIALEMAREGMPLRAVVSFHGSLATLKPADARTLKAKVLVCHGGDDAFVPEEDIVAFQEEMRKAKADWQFIAYGGAVHSFTNPDAGGAGIQGVAYHKEADRRSWEHMRLFLAEACGAG